MSQEKPVSLDRERLHRRGVLPHHAPLPVLLDYFRALPSPDVPGIVDLETALAITSILGLTFIGLDSDPTAISFVFSPPEGDPDPRHIWLDVPITDEEVKASRSRAGPDIIPDMNAALDCRSGRRFFNAQRGEHIVAAWLDHRIVIQLNLLWSNGHTTTICIYDDPVWVHVFDQEYALDSVADALWLRVVSSHSAAGEILVGDQSRGRSSSSLGRRRISVVFPIR
ncbi:MAG: hypothetical protein ACNA8W_19185 [Bradymonadaceae bacterium]